MPWTDLNCSSWIGLKELPLETSCIQCWSNLVGSNRLQSYPHVIQTLCKAFRRNQFWNWHQYADDAQLYITVFNSPVDMVEILSHCLTSEIKYLKKNNFNLNPDKAEIVITEKTEILKCTVLLAFNRVQ